MRATTEFRRGHRHATARPKSAPRSRRLGPVNHDALRGYAAASAFRADRTKAMKPGAAFINGGRGATVSEDALLESQDSGHPCRATPPT
ncbi:NAD(P)-dependent oxidoreductase [Variovorax boronicumulans]|uniref:NAD(P)-dependent oxidoreductase n=1 Tax=Variovorax boronicumulans TaxID=436515 RepID=UPI0036F2B606